MAKRHLKLSGRLIENNTRVEVKVLEQSHYGSEFGNSCPTTWTNNPYGDVAFKHKQMLLLSQPRDYFMLHHYTASENWLLVRSTAEIEPSRTMQVTLREWKEIKEAVAAYNKWGETQ